MALEAFVREALPAVEGEMRAVVDGVAGIAADSLYLSMLRYHLGWADEQLRPAAVEGGKRIRPIATLLACQGSGAGWASALPAAAAVELVHNFSLIHDDIQDNSPIRRGRATVWKLWGEAQAINAGDAMFTLAHLALQRLPGRGVPAPAVLAALAALDLTCLRLTQGQHLDLAFEQRQDVSVGEYLEMIAGKTAALIACSLQLGAVVAGAGSERVEHFRLYGLNLGLAFQVLDDVLGIWGDSGVTGKSAATDVERRKKSLPVMYALARDAVLRELYARGGQSPQTTLAIVERIEAAGGREYALAQARIYSDLALAHLRAAEPEGEAGAALEELTAMLLSRER